MFKIKLFSPERSYIPVVLILVLLAVLNFFINEYRFNTLLTYGEIINKSGKQRMLSQRSLLLAHLYHDYKNSDTLATLKITLRSMEKLNEFLSSQRLDSDLKVLYFDDGLKNEVDQYVQSIQEFMQYPDDTHIEISSNKAEALLTKLDNAVSLHEKHNLNILDDLRFIEYIVLFITFLFLIFLVVFVIVPLKRLIRAQLDKLRFKNTQLQALERTLNTYVIMTATDLDGHIINASDEFCSMTGYTKSELIGQNQNIIRHPDVPTEVFAKLWKNIKSGKTFTGVLKGIAKDGSTFMCESFIYPVLDADGDTIAYVGLRKNITDKYKLEELNRSLEEKVSKRTQEQNQLLSLFDKGDVALFKWKNDVSWSIQHVSDTTTKIFGYTKDEFLSGKLLYIDIIHKDDKSRVANEVKAALEKNLNFIKHEPYRVIKKNKEMIWILDNTLIIKDEYGSATDFLGYITDITQDLKQRDALQQQSKMAAMGEMIGSIAHQWRQPLNALGINIQNLKYDYDDSLIDKRFISEFINQNNQTIKFMSDTIDDFRNFFRIDKEKILFSVEEVITSTISMQSSQLKELDIAVYVTGDDFKLLSYKNEFQQVILNVLNNAKDALVENKIKNPRIDIEIKDISVLIRDNAGGISKSIIDRIFEPYFTTKDQGKGTGIGMYMSKMIIEENMNGRLSVKNVGGGAEISILFFSKYNKDLEKKETSTKGVLI